jgi:DNA-binding response OmpR family regulator
VPTRKEYDLLSLLVENAGTTVPRQILMDRVWEYRNEIRTETLKMHIHKVRKALGSYGPQYIENIFGIGYRFQPATGEPSYRPGVQTSAVVKRLKIVPGE